MARLILGHTTSSSIKIWLRASERWPFAHIEIIGPNKSLGIISTSTTKEEFYIKVIEINDLVPVTRYKVKLSFSKDDDASYEDHVRDSYTEGNFTTFPDSNEKGSFNFIFGSCNLHSLGFIEKPDRSWLEISKIAKRHKASFMLHCGDQIYSDIPLKPPINVQHFRDKYLDAWGDCIPARRVLTELPHYMILDDHEIINNYDRADGTTNQALAYEAIKAYWEFQHSHNPDSRHSEHHYHYEFNYGKAYFFVMDTRFYRNSKEGRLIDEVQELDLMEWLERNKSELKFIVTSVPFVGVPKNSESDKWSDTVFTHQKERILRKIVEENISKIIFLTGDMHTSYYATQEILYEGKRALIHELMSSPINQFTPNLQPDHVYSMEHEEVLPSGLRTTSKIDRSSFYGKHSNIMLVKVIPEIDNSFKVEFEIHRTTKDEDGPQGYFHLN